MKINENSKGTRRKWTKTVDWNLRNLDYKKDKKRKYKTKLEHEI
jgi:hypothetical protein